MYTLDFETMKQVMQEHQKTGFLYADVPAGTAGMREHCRIEINLMAGTIVSCSIVSNSGKRLTEKESHKKISRLGQLYWTFVPQQSRTIQTATQQTPPTLISPVEKEIFPLRTIQLEQWQMRSWPRIHRGIFALADGTTSVTKIAEILSTSPDLVDNALRDLQSIGAIAMRPQNGKNHA